MTTFASTVPAAITLLQEKMQAVADAHRNLKPEVYVGQVFGRQVADYYFAIGNPEGTGELVTQYQQEFEGSYALGAVRKESYSIHCSVRAWTGRATQAETINRVGEAFTLLSDLMAQLAADPTGKGDDGTDLLTSMGAWGVSEVDNPACGQIDGKGSGCLLDFIVRVDHALLH